MDRAIVLFDLDCVGKHCVTNRGVADKNRHCVFVTDSVSFGGHPCYLKLKFIILFQVSYLCDAL